MMFLALAATLTIATPPRLNVGDPAPALEFGEVLKGNPARSFESSKVTVVEFWATWCKPCIEFMPHLSDMWRQHKDQADFVSVSVMENEPAKLKAFVAGMGEKMLYPVVADKVDRNGVGSMHNRWLKAAQQESIPVAFIVDRQGKIAWIGNPTAMGNVLPKVIDRSWDAKAYRAKFEAQAKDQEATNRLLSEGFGRLMATPRTHSYAGTLAWIESNRSRYDGRDTQTALEECQTLFAAFRKGAFEEALKLAEGDPKSSFVWTYLRPMLLVARIDALQSLKRDWRGLVIQTIDGPPDPNILMNLTDALTLPDSKLIEKDPTLALKAAEKLTSLARAPMFLRRLAWAQFVNGDVDKAKSTIDEALVGMTEEKRRNPRHYQTSLASLKEAKAYFLKH